MKLELFSEEFQHKILAHKEAKEYCSNWDAVQYDIFDETTFVVSGYSLNEESGCFNIYECKLFKQ